MTTDPLRIDKWLWAARFYKTRSLASQAVDAGHVRLNGERAKPAKALKPGDRLELRIGELTWSIQVVALSDRRGPAEQARQLYHEDEASQRARAEWGAQRRLLGNPGADLRGRPTKKDRRLIHRFTGQD